MSNKTYHVMYSVQITVEAENIDEACQLADARFHLHDFTSVDGDGVFNDDWDKAKE